MLSEKDFFDYQPPAIEHVISNPFAGLLLDMGLGKTVSVLTAIHRLMYNRFEIESVLVVAPKNVAYSTWAQEVAKWEHLQHLKTALIGGNEVERRTALKSPVDIHIISVSQLCWLAGEYGGNLPFDMLVVDESSLFKNEDAQRTKALMQCSPSFQRVVIMTGTPIPNGLEDLWSQMFLLDQGKRLRQTKRGYLARWFTRPVDSDNYYRKHIPATKECEQEIFKKIGDVCISMKKEDYLDLPGKVVNDVRVEFTTTVKEQYEEFEREKILELMNPENLENPTMIPVANVTVLMMKLQQFCNGAIYDEDKNVHNIHDLKIQALKSFIEQQPGNVLILRQFQHDTDRIMYALKAYKPVNFVSGAKGTKIIKAWNEGKIKVLIGHPASMGHGLNLQHGGNTAVWFGVSWNLEQYQQANERLDRPGQTQIVGVNRLIVPGTVESDMVKRLASKAGTQNKLLSATDAQKQYIINRYKFYKNL